MRTSVLHLLISFFILLPFNVRAEIPKVISYQGKVTDTGGSPIADGNYNMRFVVFDAATGGTDLWDSGVQSVTVSNGIFNVLLGDPLAMPELDLPFDDDYWLRVTFAGINQIPRQRLASAGYAYMAGGMIPGTEVSGSVTSGTSAAIKGVNTATTGTNYGGRFKSSSTSGRGVYGYATATTGTNYGVYGRSYSSEGRGVYGWAYAATGINYGGRFESSSTSGTGVHGEAPYMGVFGWATATTGNTYGGRFESTSTSGTGVCGIANAVSGTTYGVYGQTSSPAGIGVCGEASATTGTTYGGHFQASSIDGYGIRCQGPKVGVYGHGSAFSGITYGVYGYTSSPSGHGGYFHGDVHVVGNLTKTSGSFLIDHPLDPENRLLRHNFVESPENLLIYRGKVQLDENGEAVVEMPEYFGALANEAEATVNLTPIGKRFITAYELEADLSRFRILGDPGESVAWIVYADRDDPTMRRLWRPVEEDKGPDNKYCDKGKLLDPVAYGYPESMGRDYEEQKRERERMGEERIRRPEETSHIQH